jgi:predicted DNA-binding transcriptional regulator AlpA
VASPLNTRPEDPDSRTKSRRGRRDPEVVALLHSPTASEPWLTKEQLAHRLAVSRRWIDYRRAEGMPCHKWGGIVRFRVTEVEAWLNERSSPR